MYDRADVGCVVYASATHASGFNHTLSALLDIPLPDEPGITTCVKSLRPIWLSPHEWLVLCELKDELRLLEAAKNKYPDGSIHAARYTDRICWFDLSGDDAEPLLKQGGFLSLEGPALMPGHSKRTLIANISVIIVHTTSNWLIGVERDYVKYFVTWAAEAHERMHVHEHAG